MTLNQSILFFSRTQRNIAFEIPFGTTIYNQIRKKSGSLHFGDLFELYSTHYSNKFLITVCINSWIVFIFNVFTSDFAEILYASSIS